MFMNCWTGFAWTLIYWTGPISLLDITKYGKGGRGSGWEIINGLITGALCQNVSCHASCCSCHSYSLSCSHSCRLAWEQWACNNLTTIIILIVMIIVTVPGKGRPKLIICFGCKHFPECHSIVWNTCVISLLQCSLQETKLWFKELRRIIISWYLVRECL